MGLIQRISIFRQEGECGIALSRPRYGFYDFQVSKQKIYIESINYDGTFPLHKAHGFQHVFTLFKTPGSIVFDVLLRRNSVVGLENPRKGPEDGDCLSTPLTAKPILVKMTVVGSTLGTAPTH